MRQNFFNQLDRDGSSGRLNSTQLNTIDFDELTYGNYHLIVNAKSGDTLSEPLDFHFRVLPYWYQTLWFKVIFVLVLISLVVGYFLNRERRARVAKKQLEQLVEEQTVVIRQEKSEVTRQLEQKEILMQEVHHRVKNNLTFLKSLLYLRSNASEEKEVRQILDECQARIHSMALVHQNLYDVEDSSQVNFQVFLKELFSELRGMFDEDISEIQFELYATHVKIDMKLSVFLGLILNELITNSFKYAFNGKSTKKSV